MHNDTEKEQKLLEDMRQVYSLLFITANKLQTEVDANLTRLTSRQLMLLTAIAHCDPDDASIMKISAILDSTKQNVTRMVQSLCKKGILKSTASKIDKRSVNIQLTDMGRSLLEENVPKGNAYFLKIFQDFSADEVTLFRTFLEKLSDYDKSHQSHLENPIQSKLHVDQSDMKSIYKELHEKLKQ